MYNPSTQSIIILIVGISLLLLLLISFIITIVYKYQQKQNAHFKDIATLKASYENLLLQSQLEMQEQTFQNISREIHDNIGQKLTLAKLYLNTLDITNTNKVSSQINSSVEMIGDAINDLSDISRSMSSEIILNNGLIKALEFEVEQLNKPGVYNITLSITGNSVFLAADKELVLFRIVQEALNNVIKHSLATTISLQLNYEFDKLILTIIDNGKGFDHTTETISGTGLSNMAKRTQLLKGNFIINSTSGKGTIIKIEIPIYDDNSTI